MRVFILDDPGRGHERREGVHGIGSKDRIGSHGSGSGSGGGSFPYGCMIGIQSVGVARERMRLKGPVQGSCSLENQ